MRPSIFGTRDRRLGKDIRRICRMLTRDFGLGQSAVNVIFVNDQEITQLNRRFLEHNRPTDVMAFAGDAPSLPGEPHLLGEVYVSRERARAQAREYAVSYSAELRHLALHGLLHLLGLTHRQMEPYYRKYLSRRQRTK